MTYKKALITALAIVFFQGARSQNLDFDFIKKAIDYSGEELALELSNKKFKLIEKEHKNIGDKLINKSDYYSNKTEESSIEGVPETALFANSKRSKKTLFISFSQALAFDNFNNLENDIKSNFKKENVLQSEKYESAIIKYSFNKNLYYLFKEEDTYYIIISNYPLEETYFVK